MSSRKSGAHSPARASMSPSLRAWWACVTVSSRLSIWQRLRSVAASRAKLRCGPAGGRKVAGSDPVARLSSSGERGADRTRLGPPQGREDLVGELDRDREGGGAPAVRRRGRELGVSGRDRARVAHHRPAAGAVAKHSEPGGVVARPRRIGLPAVEELGLLLLDPGAEEPAARVAPGEPVEVGWRRNHATGCPCPTAPGNAAVERREPLAVVLGDPLIPQVAM